VRTAYIVFWHDAPVFAFDTRKEAEEYIQGCCKVDLERGGRGYSREELYYKPVDFVNDLDKMTRVLKMEEKENK